MGAIFWLLFGQINRENFKIEGEECEAIWQTGMILFGAFNVVAVLVALTMLIAMLNESYSHTDSGKCYLKSSHSSSGLRISHQLFIYLPTIPVVHMTGHVMGMNPPLSQYYAMS